MVDLLSEDETLTTSQREYVSSIQLSGRALLTIVNDILDFSKIESGRLDIEEVPFNLFSTLQELYKLLRVFANQKDLEFIYENDIEESLEVLGDPGRIRQVLSNLLTNALKFTENGSVKISAKGERIPQPDGIEDDRIIATFVIKDTGIGISKTTLDKLFKPFSQGDSSTARLYGGTGLGLTISRNVSNLFQWPFNHQQNLIYHSSILTLLAGNPNVRNYKSRVGARNWKYSHVHDSNENIQASPAISTSSSYRSVKSWLHLF